MIRKDFHPLFFRDVEGIEAHILSVTEDPVAALRRIDEIDALIAAIQSNPLSGIRLRGRLDGCLVRHGGRDQKIRIVYRPMLSDGVIRYGLVSFGGQNWSALAEDRL